MPKIDFTKLLSTSRNLPFFRLTPPLSLFGKKLTHHQSSFRFPVLAIRLLSFKKITLLTLIFSVSVSGRANETLIIWDVGQGSSHSIIKENSCLHFDLGGEKSPVPNILKLCQKKKNFVFISHFDYDHINFIEELKQTKSLCLILPKNDPTHWFFKKHLRQNCDTDITHQVKSIYIPHVKTKNRNHKSIIYAYKKHVLFTGDTTKEQEELWVPLVKNNYSYILLGHHGSNTSNSPSFLKLFGPKSVALGSARKGKYGHPHKEIEHRLKIKKIPKLLTEDWGSIHISLE